MNTHDKTVTRMAALLEEHPDFLVVRLRSRSDVEAALLARSRGLSRIDKYQVLLNELRGARCPLLMSSERSDPGYGCLGNTRDC